MFIFDGVHASRYVGPYFGFRLLTSNLQFVANAETVVDFGRSEGWVTKKGGHHDCRLQVEMSKSYLDRLARRNHLRI